MPKSKKSAIEKAMEAAAPKRVLRYATKELEFKIKPIDIEEAKCKDPRQCVIARALCRALPENFQLVEVGSTTTHIVYATEVFSYRTPYRLSKALRAFDLTGDWHLPPGDYFLGIWNPAKRSRKRKVKDYPKELTGQMVTFMPSVRAPRTRVIMSGPAMCDL